LTIKGEAGEALLAIDTWLKSEGPRGSLRLSAAIADDAKNAKRSEVVFMMRKET
jgi:hypothetical protein